MAFWTEISNHPIRAFKTLALLSTWLSLGMSLGIVGPTLLDLSEMVQVKLEDGTAFALSARSGGYAIGCITMGIIYSKVNFMLSSSIVLAASAILTFCFTYLDQLWQLLTMFAINGVCLGFFEAGSNVFILQLWGKETPPFMQSLHFMFGLGSLIAPIVAEPFLIKRTDQQIAQDDEDSRINSLNSTTTATKIFHPELVRLWIPYTIIAALLAVNSVFVLIVWKMYPATKDHPSRIESPAVTSLPESETNSVGNNNGNILTTNQNSTTKKDVKPDAHYKEWKIVTIILSLIFMHIYLGLEISFGSFLLTFAVDSKMGLSKTAGANLTSLFWATFTFVRILTILIIAWAGNARIIFGSLIIVLSANGILTPYGNEDVTLLSIGVGLIGMGMSSVWACMFGFLESFFPVTSIIGALMVVSAVLGEFVFPVIISNSIESNPQILMSVVLVCSIGIAVLFIAIYAICNLKLNIKPPAAEAKASQVEARYCRTISVTSVH